MPFGTLAQPLAARTRAVSRMEKFIIEGGYPLSGTVVPAATRTPRYRFSLRPLLTEEEVVLRNVPRIRDVGRCSSCSCGSGSRRAGSRTTWCRSRRTTWTAATWTPKWSERIRASFLLAGPLLRPCGRAEMPVPGGDVIGRRRRLDPHLDAFRALGADVHVDRGYRIGPRPASAPATSSWTSRR